jgi:broad specificity phosphatase PhoE
MNTNIYLSRHLQRIDDSGANNREIEKKWNETDSKISEFIINPYLSDKAFESANIQKLIDSFPAETIDIIITSPFLRCMETSIKLQKEINKLKESQYKNPINQIHINFQLSEIIDDITFYSVEMPLNIEKIFNFSKKYLIEKYKNNICPEIFIIDKSEFQTIHDISEEKYFERIKTGLENIYIKYNGLNILVITHAHSGIIFELKPINYTHIIHIDPKLIGINSESHIKEQKQEFFKYKYLKYKKKYLFLKNKN